MHPLGLRRCCVFLDSPVCMRRGAQAVAAPGNAAPRPSTEGGRVVGDTPVDPLHESELAIQRVRALPLHPRLALVAVDLLPQRGELAIALLDFRLARRVRMARPLLGPRARHPCARAGQVSRWRWPCARCMCGDGPRDRGRPEVYWHIGDTPSASTSPVGGANASDCWS